MYGVQTGYTINGRLVNLSIEMRAVKEHANADEDFKQMSADGDDRRAEVSGSDLPLDGRAQAILPSAPPCPSCELG